MRTAFVIALAVIASGCAVLRGTPLDPLQTKLNGARQMVKVGNCREALPTLEEVQAARSSESIQEEINRCKAEVAALEAQEKALAEYRRRRAVENLYALSPGDAKGPIVEALGNPEKREIVEGAEVFHYLIYDASGAAPYQVKFRDGKLVGYHRDDEAIEKIRERADRERMVAAQEEQVRVQERARQDAAWRGVADSINQQNAQRRQDAENHQRRMEALQPKQVNCTSTPGYGGTVYTNCR